jgi:hypothetical protein
MIIFSYMNFTVKLPAASLGAFWRGFYKIMYGKSGYEKKPFDLAAISNYTPSGFSESSPIGTITGFSLSDRRRD